MNPDEIIKLVLKEVNESENGEIIIPISQVDTNDILSVMGKIRAIGLSATVTSKGIEIKPKEIKKSFFRRERLREAQELLLKSDPALFPSDHPNRDIAFFKYWGIYGSEIDGELWISTSQKPKKKSKSEIPPEIQDAIYNELPVAFQATDPAVARRLFLLIKRNFGSLQLLTVKQLGSIVSLSYKPKLPLTLTGKFKQKTVVGWATELAAQIGVNAACISYNSYIKEIKGKILSISDFKNLISVQFKEEDKV